MKNTNRTLSKFESAVLNCFPSQQIESCINECIAEFNFVEAKKIFNLMNYQWYSKDGGLHVPDISCMKSECKEFLYEAFAKLIVEHRNKYSITTGRFKMTAYRTKENNTVRYDAEIEFTPISWSTNI